MADLALAVHDAVLERARQRALEEGTSVNVQVRAFLERYADSRSGFEGFLELTEGLGARSRTAASPRRRFAVTAAAPRRVSAPSRSPEGPDRID